MIRFRRRRAAAVSDSDAAAQPNGTVTAPATEPLPQRLSPPGHLIYTIEFRIRLNSASVTPRAGTARGEAGGSREQVPRGPGRHADTARGHRARGAQGGRPVRDPRGSRAGAAHAQVARTRCLRAGPACALARRLSPAPPACAQAAACQARRDRADSEIVDAAAAASRPLPRHRRRRRRRAAPRRCGPGSGAAERAVGWPGRAPARFRRAAAAGAGSGRCGPDRTGPGRTGTRSNRFVARDGH